MVAWSAYFIGVASYSDGPAEDSATGGVVLRRKIGHCQTEYAWSSEYLLEKSFQDAKPLEFHDL